MDEFDVHVASTHRRLKKILKENIILALIVVATTMFFKYGG